MKGRWHFSVSHYAVFYTIVTPVGWVPQRLSVVTEEQVFTGWTTFLSPSQQCQGTEGNKSTDIIQIQRNIHDWPHPFLIYQLISPGWPQNMREKNPSFPGFSKSIIILFHRRGYRNKNFGHVAAFKVIFSHIFTMHAQKRHFS